MVSGLDLDPVTWSNLKPARKTIAYGVSIRKDGKWGYEKGKHLAYCQKGE